MCALAVLACGGDPAARRPGLDVAAEFATVTAARGELASARARLERAGAAGATGPELRDAQAAFDAAYGRSQRALARFLTIAVNQAPGRPETRAALDLYAGDAVANARYLVDHDGDRVRARADLARALRAYAILGLPPPQRVAAAVEELDRAPRPTPTPAAGPAPGGAGTAAGGHRAAGSRRRSGGGSHPR